MSSLMHCFAGIAGSIREKTNIDIARPPLNGYLSEMRFLSSGELLVAKGLPEYGHFKSFPKPFIL